MFIYLISLADLLFFGIIFVGFINILRRLL